MKRVLPLLVAFAAFCLVAFFIRNVVTRRFFAPRVVMLPTEHAPKPEEITVIAENLHIPWEVVFLPDKSMLVTERTGNLLKIDSATHVIQNIPGVHAVGEGGLLGLALHPKFSENGLLYLFLTADEGRNLVNRVERYRFDGNKITDRKIIVDGIIGSTLHDGGRIAFGPDGLLYITTGDAQMQNLAQDTTSLNGKILRVKDDGSIPADNPFGTAVYSYGHRNAQGLAWDSQGRMWATEHGPSGADTGYDEINLIEKGKNYGWPAIRGDQTHAGMVSPVIQSGSTDTWAPAGLAYWDGSLWFGGLRGETLYEAKITGDHLTIARHLTGRFGRIRAVVVGPDHYLYLTTSNTDGRGTIKPGDDKIIRINPKQFR